MSSTPGTNPSIDRPFQEGPEEREYVAKKWGMEEILIHNDKYTCKFLWITPGFRCSLHYHILKHETFIALDGIVIVEYYIGTQRIETLLVGRNRDALTLPPGTKHRFWSMGGDGGLLLEVSTPHSDEDVVRLVPSEEMPNHEPLLGTRSVDAG
jgi:mannose-6-phosphate isomerase-like protein (cupin superfamily)